MHIKSLRALHFRRFTDLTISGIPATTRLVVLAGPNGVGKSSVFDAFRTWSYFRAEVSGSNDEDYFRKSGEAVTGWHDIARVEFHEPTPADSSAKKKAFYFRSAYRNDPDFTSASLKRVGDILDEGRIPRLIDNDATVSSNYRRLVAQTIDGLYSGANDTQSVKDLRESFVGRVRATMKRVFGDLLLQGPGDPLSNGTFYFEKGASKGFHYKNLSGGEKAAFDLLLDLIARIPAFNDTVFCIDEPETHLNTRLQATLLGELYDLIPENSQLWIATHSIGMLRKARDLYETDHQKVAFLDFDGHNFDAPVTLQPLAVDRAFWGRTLGVALDDLARLVAPKRVVLCEGRPQGATHSAKAEFDAKCYRTIFQKSLPDTDFISVGNSTDVWTDRVEIGKAIQTLVGGTIVVRVIDRDARSPQEVADATAAGIRVLSRRHLESYLLDDEILTSLCTREGQPHVAPQLIAAHQTAIANSVARGNPPDDIKSAAGETYNAAKRLLALTTPGNSSDAFLRDTMAPLVVDNSATYAELYRDIFGP
jgi:predicted ATPase